MKPQALHRIPSARIAAQPGKVEGSEGVSKIADNTKANPPANPNCKIPIFRESHSFTALPVNKICTA